MKILNIIMLLRNETAAEIFLKSYYSVRLS